MRRTIQGKVISDKMDKTIVVKIDRKVKHPFYGKYITRSTKVYAHDNDNAAKIGDIVLIEESRPISKTKNWLLKTVIERGEG